MIFLGQILKIRRFLNNDFSYYFMCSCLPLIFVCGGGLLYGEFVIHAILKNVTLNGFILMTASFGSLCIFLRFFYVKKEFGRLFDFKSNDFSWTNDMENTKGEYISSAYLVYLSRLYEMKGKAYQDISYAKQEIDVLKHNLDSRLDLPQFVVGLMIALGLFGTFVGLLETLIKVGDLLSVFSQSDVTAENADKAISGLISNLKDPLEAMGTAFSASMFGLVFSIALGLMMISLRSYQNRYIENAKEVYDDIVALLSGNVSNDQKKDDVVSLSDNFNGLGNSSNYFKNLSYIESSLNESIKNQNVLIDNLSELFLVIKNNSEEQRKLIFSLSDLSLATNNIQNKFTKLMDVMHLVPAVMERSEHISLELEKMMRSVLMLQVQSEMDAKFIANEINDNVNKLSLSYQEQSNRISSSIAGLSFNLENKVAPYIITEFSNLQRENQKNIIDSFNSNLSLLTMMSYENKNPLPDNK